MSRSMTHKPGTDSQGATALMLIVCLADDPHQIGAEWHRLLQGLPEQLKGGHRYTQGKISVIPPGMQGRTSHICHQSRLAASLLILEKASLAP